MQGVPIIGIAGEAARVHNQVALERGADAGLDAKLIGRTSLVLAVALHLWGVPGAEFALAATVDTLSRLCMQLTGLLHSLL